MAASGTGAGLETIKENRRFSFLRPYRADVQQGNFISGEMVSQLKPGMTPEQVRFVLGTPLLTDIFHRDQWTYAFDMRRGNGETTRGRLTLYFSDNRLERWEGGDLPGEEAYLARISGAVPGNKNKVDDVTPAPARAPSAAKESRY
ncbi:MAG: small protein [Paucimonas sp.]|nr:small protein [Paucimonas sp.]